MEVNERKVEMENGKWKMGCNGLPFFKKERPKPWLLGKRWSRK